MSGNKSISMELEELHSHVTFIDDINVQVNGEI